jgi:peptidoglycan/xylan/chitin deacetylase (PgdA/CDA1 family)
LVLAYHDVSPSSAPQHADIYSTTPELFIQQIEFLSRYFDCVGLNDLVASPTRGGDRPRLAVTFDDGFLSVVTHALPYLDSRKIPYSLFINSCTLERDKLWMTDVVCSACVPGHLRSLQGRVPAVARVSPGDFEANPTYHLVNRVDFDGGTTELERPGWPGLRLYLDEKELRALRGPRVTFGNHSANHYNLARCSADTLRSEIATTKATLERILEQPIVHFAIPFGKKEHYSRTVLREIAGTGHTHAHTTNPTPFSVPTASAGVPELGMVPRLGLSNQSVSELIFLINRALITEMDL